MLASIPASILNLTRGPLGIPSRFQLTQTCSSLGFGVQSLESSLATQGFQLGRCIYDPARQKAVAKSIITKLIRMAATHGSSRPTHPSQSFHPLFYDLEADLLKIAALIKHSGFAEEREWRAVSESRSNYVGGTPISYRAGKTSLVPYLIAPLPRSADNLLSMQMAMLGPSPNPNLAARALSMFLARYAECPQVGASGIPYREW